MKVKYILVTLLLPLLLHSITGAGVEIRNQATCEFEWNNNTYIVTSNSVVTKVLPVYMFNVSPDGNVQTPGQLRYGFPGNTVYLNYVLLNTGNAEDSYDLTTIVGYGNFQPVSRAIYIDANRNGRLDPGEGTPINHLSNVAPEDPVYLIVSLDVPETVQGGDSLYLDIIATSNGDTSLIDTNNWALVKIEKGPVILGSKQAFPTGAISPGDTIVFRVNFINNGMAFADTLVITEWINRNDNLNYTSFKLNSIYTQPDAEISYYSNSLGRWITDSPSDPTDVGGVRATYANIWPGQLGYMQFTVIVDSNIQDTLITNVATIYYNSVYNNQSYSFSTNVTCNIVQNSPTVVIGPYGNPAASPDSSENDMQTVDTARAGGWVYFVNSILNLGPGNTIVEIGYDSSNLNISGGFVMLTTADFTQSLYDSDNDGFVDIGPVAENDTVNIGVKIYLPATQRDTLYHSLTLYVFTPDNRSSLNYTVDRFRILSQAPQAAVNLSKSVSPDTFVYTNTTLQFTIQFENTGSIPLTDFNMYDVVDNSLSDPHNVTSGLVRDLNNPSRLVNVSVVYDTSNRLITWYMDTLPVGFKGEVHFSAVTQLDSGITEGYIHNVVSAISDEIRPADTSNRVRVHVVYPALTVSKEVDKHVAEIGDVVNYKVYITSSTPGGEQLSDLILTDTLPEGFKVIRNSIDVHKGNSNIDSVWISKNKQIIKIYIDTLRSGNTTEIQYAAAISPSADLGKHSNTVYVRGYLPGGAPLDAGPARAVVEITEGFATPRGFIFGKVFVDRNNNRIQDPGEPGVPDIGIQTDDGIYVLTDSLGRYHIPYLSPGPHIVRIDPRTIPRNVTVPPTSIDYLGGGYAQLVSLPVSSNRKVNFRLIPKIEVERQYKDVRVRKIAITHASKIKFKTTLPATYFETGKATLKKNAPFDKFREIAEFVKKHPDWKILIEGHTDPRPIHTPEFPNNYVLSLARANAVKRVFLQYGVPDSVIITKGYGPDRPKVPNKSLLSMSFNRRVEITLIPGKIKGNSDIVEYQISLKVDKKFNKSLWLVDKIPPGGEIIESSIKARPGLFKYYVADSVVVFYIPDFSQSREYHFSYKVKVSDVSYATSFVNTLRPVIRENGVFKLLPSVATRNNLKSVRGIGEIILRLQNNILFETGKAELKPGAEVILKHVLDILKSLPDAVCEISGHTDPRPIHTKEFPSNWELSEARAKSVYSWLVKHGVDPSRMSYKGYADTRPLVPNTSLHNMQINRRVEIVIKTKGKGKSSTSSDSNTVKIINLFVHYPFVRYMGDLQITDKLPDGFYYVENSAFVGNIPLDSVWVQGRFVNFYIKNEITKTLSDNFALEYLASKKNQSQVGVVSDKLKYLLNLAESSYPDILYPPTNLIYRKGTAIKVKVGSIYKMPVELYVNGSKVSNKKVGLIKIDRRSKIEEREFIGVKLKPGKNTIRLKTVDRRGKIVNITRNVYVPGKPAKLKLRLKGFAMADGHTKPKVSALLTDSADVPVGDNFEITFETDNLEIISPDDRPAIPGYQKITKNGEVEITLAPSLAPISGKIFAFLSDSVFDSIEVFYMPYASGIDAFGGFDFKGKYSFDSKNLTSEEFAGIYLKGLLPGNIVLTSTYRYNSFFKYFIDKEDEHELLRNYYANVSSYNLYPFYGDASKVGRVTASRTGLFARLDKGRSYVQYGDFKRGIGGASIAKYNRALTGGLFHLESKFIEIDGFVAPDKQQLYREEFRADGTPGYFYLSHTPIIRNSEVVYVITKDRIHPDIILRKIKLAPYSDYSLDIATGALLLREPVPSYDSNLNPNYIVVIYEVKVDIGKLAYAGSFAIKPLEGIKIGMMRGYSTPGGDRWFALNGIYGSLNLNPILNAWFDVAQSDSSGNTGMAYAGGIKLNAGSIFRADAKYTKRDSSFRNDGNIGGRMGEELTVRSSLSFLRSWSLTNSFEYRTMPDRTISKTGEALVNKSFGRHLSMGIGYRYTSESNDTSEKHVSSAVLGVNSNLGSRLSISARHEQVLEGASLTVDPPRSEVKAAARIFKNVSLKASYEHKWGDFGSDIGLVGIENSFSQYVSSYTKFRYEENRLGVHNQVVAGIKNSIPLSEKFKILFNGEYVKDLKYPDLDHTTGGTGFEYHGRGKLSARFNVESRKNGYKTVSQLSGALPISRSFGIVLDEKFVTEHKNKGLVDNRLSDGYIGFAYRPAFTDVINAFFVLRHYYNTDTTYGKKNRVVLYSDINFQPFYPLTISGRYGFKKMLGSSGYGLTTHLLSLWLRIELLKDRLYVAGGTRTLIQPLVEAAEQDASVELGVVIKRNILLGVGFNVHGLSDSDFSEFEQTDKGIYLRLGAKFNILRGLIK